MATLESVHKELQLQLKTMSPIVLRTVAIDTLGKQRKRIFTDGIASNGSPIGQYTPFTVRIKKEKGRFTSKKVNLRDTETLVNSMVTEPSGRKSYQTGFIAATSKDAKGKTVTNKEKIREIEQKYGEVFDLTQGEEAGIDVLINKVLTF